MAETMGFWQRVRSWFSGTGGDIETPERETIKPLNPGSIGADLDRLCEIVQRKAYATIGWYAGARHSKKRAAWWIRLGAILFVSLAGLVPVLDAAGLIDEQPTVVAVITEGDAGSVDLREVEQTAGEVRGRFAGLELGQLGYVFAAIAAALVGLDRFLGLSTGWVRYITAELSLRKALADFQMNWVIRNAELADDAGEQKCPRERLALIKDFSSRIDEYVEAETKQWAAEFQGALTMLQTAVREAQEAARPGTVQITVQPGAGINPEATVYVDGEARGRTSSGALTVTRVSAGGHEVAAVGEREDGGEVRASTSITVPAGGVVPVALKLE